MSSGIALEAEGGRWKRYPAYWDSGVEWLGAVPEGWGILPLKRLGGFQAGAGFPEAEQGIEDEELPFYKVSDMNLKGNEIFMKVHNNSVSRETAANLRAHILPPETIIFAKVGAALLLNRRRILTIPSCIDNNTMGFTKGSCDLKWLYYWMCGIDLGEIANPGAVPSVNESQMQRLYVPVPTLPEQRAIAAFLDRETGRIDALIAKKERQIELLQEKRTTLISHAVTKGLDPDAPMKDSGVEWLGEVPEHWTVAPLYARYHVRLGKMLDGKRITGAHLAPYLRNVNVQWGKVDVSDLPMMDFSPSERVRLSLQKGDLLVCEGGEVGRTAVWGGEIDRCYYQKAIHRLRPQNETDCNRFFYYVMFMAAHIGVFAAGADISTIGHLTAEKLRKHRFVFPPKKEQHEIADYLDGATPKITSIVENVSDSIAKLREYRTSLISAAVTGKIDVRGELVS